MGFSSVAILKATPCTSILVMGNTPNCCGNANREDDEALHGRSWNGVPMGHGVFSEKKIQTEGQFGRGLCPTAWLGHTRAYSATIDRWKSVAVIHCNHVTTCLEFPTTTGLYRLFLGYCTPSMKLSYHSEVIGTYSPFHS